MNNTLSINTNYYTIFTKGDYTVIINSSCTTLTITDPYGKQLLRKENILVMQTFGNYISVKENGLMGAYRIDGAMAVPFEFKIVFIDENGILVSKDDSNTLVPYNK